jgi:anti-anti-sigma factor
MHETPFRAFFRPETTTLVVAGTISETDRHAFRQALRDATDGYRRAVTVDLTAVEFFPSLAVGVLIGARRACGPRGSITVVACPDSIVRRVLDIVGIPLVDDVEDGGESDAHLSALGGE